MVADAVTMRLPGPVLTQHGINLYIGFRYFEWRKESSVFILKSFFFSFSDVGENGDVP
jgi:hypothetical protein